MPRFNTNPTAFAIRNFTNCRCIASWLKPRYVHSRFAIQLMLPTIKKLTTPAIYGPTQGAVAYTIVVSQMKPNTPITANCRNCRASNRRSGGR